MYVKFLRVVNLSMLKTHSSLIFDATQRDYVPMYYNLYTQVDLYFQVGKRIDYAGYDTIVDFLISLVKVSNSSGELLRFNYSGIE